MKERAYLMLYTNKGTRKLPVSHGGADTFVADQPEFTGTVTELRLYSEALEGPVHFVFDPLSFESEEGHWTFRRTGRRHFTLEYYPTKRFGRMVQDPLVTKWNREKEDIESN